MKGYERDEGGEEKDKDNKENKVNNEQSEAARDSFGLKKINDGIQGGGQKKRDKQNDEGRFDGNEKLTQEKKGHDYQCGFGHAGHGKVNHDVIHNFFLFGGEGGGLGFGCGLKYRSLFEPSLFVF
ncbi:MAG: hypothetical protein WCW30_01725 [Candidatus Gracilibacteria bacterium]